MRRQSIMYAAYRVQTDAHRNASGQLWEPACPYVHVAPPIAPHARKLMFPWFCSPCLAMRFQHDQQPCHLPLSQRPAFRAVSLTSLRLLSRIPVDVERHECFPLHNDNVRHLLHLHVLLGLLLPVRRQRLFPVLRSQQGSHDMRPASRQAELLGNSMALTEDHLA